jgi:hypothetical protein
MTSCKCLKQKRIKSWLLSEKTHTNNNTLTDICVHAIKFNVSITISMCAKPDKGGISCFERGVHVIHHNNEEYLVTHKQAGESDEAIKVSRLYELERAGAIRSY